MLGPNFVSIEYAEQKWAERESAFAQEIAALRALLATPIDSAAQSEGGDLENPTKSASTTMRPGAMWTAPSAKSSSAKARVRLIHQKDADMCGFDLIAHEGVSLQEVMRRGLLADSGFPIYLVFWLFYCGLF